MRGLLGEPVRPTVPLDFRNRGEEVSQWLGHFYYMLGKEIEDSGWKHDELHMSPSGRMLVSLSDGKAIRVYKTQTMEKIAFFNSGTVTENLSEFVLHSGKPEIILLTDRHVVLTVEQNIRDANDSVLHNYLKVFDIQSGELVMMDSVSVTSRNNKRAVASRDGDFILAMTMKTASKIGLVDIANQSVRKWTQLDDIVAKLHSKFEPDRFEVSQDGNTLFLLDWAQRLVIVDIVNLAKPTLVSDRILPFHMVLSLDAKNYSVDGTVRIRYREKSGVETHSVDHHMF